MDEHHDAELAHSALAMAVAIRGGKQAIAGVIMHTDQPSEYAAMIFLAACGRMGIKQSMGRAGSALDNAVIESWHSTLEFELRTQPAALRHQGRGRCPSRGLDRRIQPRPQTLLGRHAQPDQLRTPVTRQQPTRSRSMTNEPTPGDKTIAQSSPTSRPSASRGRRP
jgi:transposase InsO family protein